MTFPPKTIICYYSGVKEKKGQSEMVSAIVLAAGESKRMGQLKQLMSLGDGTIIERSVDNLLASGIGEVIVVLGHRAGEVAGAIAGRPVKTVVNPAYRQGMSTSILAGLGLVSSEAEAVMLALADQPFIDGSAVNRLIEEFLDHDRGIVVPTYRGRRGHPVIFSLKYREELAGLRGDVGGRKIIAEHPDDVLEVAVDTPGVNIDIDDMDEYRSHCR